MSLFNRPLNVFDVLKEDHDEAKLLMEKIADTQSNEEASHLFAELKQKLTAHAEAEEAAFYPRLRNEEDTHEHVLEADTEHRLAKQLLDELEKSEVDDEWRAKFMVLKANVEHHVKHEEGEIFPRARRILDRTEAQNLAAVVEEEKEMHLHDMIGV